MVWFGVVRGHLKSMKMTHFWHPKTRLPGVVCLILYLAALEQCRLVTDKLTDRHTTTAYRRAIKTAEPTYYAIWGLIQVDRRIIYGNGKFWVVIRPTKKHRESLLRCTQQKVSFNHHDMRCDLSKKKYLTTC